MTTLKKDIQFSDQLKEVTWPIHQQVDKQVFLLLQRQSQELPYLFANWCQLINTGGLSDNMMADDLVDLKMDKLIASLPLPKESSTSKSEPKNEYRSLGIYYVIRGSANGSRYLINKFSSEHPMWQYFNYLSSLQDTRWLDFKKHLNSVPTSKQSEVVAGAIWAFESLLQQVSSLSASEQTTQ